MLAPFLLAALPFTQASERSTPPEATPLEALTDESWRVVVGQVVEVREHRTRTWTSDRRLGPGADLHAWRDPSVWFARVEVERALLGEEEELWVFAGDLEAGGGRLLLQGDTALLFLEPTRRPAGRDHLLDGAQPFAPLARGAWKLGSAGYARPRGFDGALPEGLAVGDGHAAPAALERWLAARLDARCPSVHAHVSTTGPVSPWLELDAAGVSTASGWQVEGTATERHDPAAVAGFWRAVAEQRFFTLPLHVPTDTSSGPGAHVWALRVRTRERGTYEVRVHHGGTALPDPAPDDESRFARLTRVWRALPGGAPFGWRAR